MRTWSLMYALIWVAFIQILVILFPVLGLSPALDLHALIGILVVILGVYIFMQVRKTSCPERIKRITRVTAYLSVFQVILGFVLYVGLRLGVGVPFQDFILFLHVVNALAIITQASSSATAFDMWEQKEFV